MCDGGRTCESRAQRATFNGPRSTGQVHAHEVDELTPTVGKSSEGATGGAVGEVELYLGDAMPGTHGVERHPDLHAEAAREREHVLERAGV
jgi:hypothetical protein